jgi:hypothetical protein
LFQGAVRPVGVVEVFVLAQHEHQVPLIPHQGSVQQFTTAAADPPFHDRIHLRRLDRGADHPDACRVDHRVERRSGTAIAVMQHELHSRTRVVQVREQVPGLLNYPRLDRVLRRAQDPYPAGAMLDHSQNIDLAPIEQAGGEEVQRQDSLRLRPQELGPARAIPARRRIDPSALEDLPHGGPRHDHAGPGQFAVNAAVPPRLVLPGQAQHHRPDITAYRRPATAAPAGPARPPAADDVTMPSQDGAGSDDQPHRRQTLHRQRPGQQGQPRPVRPRQTGASPWQLALGNSELVPQHQDLSVLPPRLATRQAQQRHSTGDDEEDQLQAHKPKIIPPPVRPGSARQTPDAEPTRP